MLVAHILALQYPGNLRLMNYSSKINSRKQSHGHVLMCVPFLIYLPLLGRWYDSCIVLVMASMPRILIIGVTIISNTIHSKLPKKVQREAQYRGKLGFEY